MVRTFPTGDAPAPARWRRYARTLFFASLSLLAAMVAFIVAVDPWRALPVSLPMARPMTSDNQRLLYPMLLRTGEFDSFIFGNSTGFLIDPAALSGGFGGRFANLSIADGQAWEQLEMIRFALGRVAQPRTLVVTIDHRVWCVATLARERIHVRRFPLWLYQEPSWANLRHMINDAALLDAGRVVLFHLGLFTPPIRDDGFYDFAGDEHDYNADSARRLIYADGRGRLDPPLEPPASVSPEQHASWTFPAADQLARVLQDVPAATRVVLATMPAHMAGQPRRGSVDAERRDACNARFARVAGLHGGALVDFAVESDVTRTDTNYFDRLHYRKAVAQRLEQSLLAAFGGGPPDPDGFWRLIDAR